MEGELVNIDATEGLVLLLDGPSMSVPPGPHVHLYSPSHWAWREHDLDRNSRVFFAGLKTLWGALGMSGSPRWTRPDAHRWPYVQAMEWCWPELQRLTPRLRTSQRAADGSMEPLASLNTALVGLGLSQAELLGPHARSIGDFSALLNRLHLRRDEQGLPPLKLVGLPPPRDPTPRRAPRA